MCLFSRSLKYSTVVALSFACTAAYGHPGHDHDMNDAFPGGESGPSGNFVIPSYTVTANGTPILNSNPGSMGSLYIDFDGGTWYGNKGAYDTDGNAATFSTSEQHDIIRAWHDVSTHFAMFDVNVTTIEPDRTVTPTASVLVSNDASGGSANSFGFGGLVPTGAVASSFARNRSTGITHELGHILTLGHQSVADANGNLVSVYRGVDGSNIAPIMGLDFQGKFSSWQEGVRPAGNGTTTPQNDVEQIANNIITTYNSFSGGTYAGDGFREDDHRSDRHKKSTSLGRNPNDKFVEGIIERYDDEDWFKFAWDGGAFHAFAEADRNAAASPEFASSLGINLELYLKNGTLIDIDLSADPADVDAELVISNLAQGNYNLRVSGAGDVDDLGTYNLWVNPIVSGSVMSAPEFAAAFAVVPEPGSLALLSLGGLFVLRRRRRG